MCVLKALGTLYVAMGFGAAALVAILILSCAIACVLAICQRKPLGDVRVMDVCTALCCTIWGGIFLHALYSC